MVKNYYDILNLPLNFTSEELKKSYRSLVKQWHPDRNNSPEARVKIIDINEAYQILSNPPKKETYDRLYRKFYQSNDIFIYQEPIQYTEKQYNEDINRLNSWIKDAKLIALRIIKNSLKTFEKSIDITSKAISGTTDFIGILFLLAFGFFSIKFWIELILGTAEFNIVGFLFSLIGGIGSILYIISLFTKEER